jgi:hypothetical protein
LARIHHDPIFVLHRLYAHHNLHGTANEKENQHVMKRTILKGMVRFYLYRMKIGYISETAVISSKNGIYRRKTAIYHRKLQYIDETADISAKLRLYHQKSDYIDEKQQYISEIWIISPKHL